MNQAFNLEKLDIGSGMVDTNLNMWFSVLFNISAYKEKPIRNPIKQRITALELTHSFLCMNWASIISNLIPNVIYMQILANYF